MPVYKRTDELKLNEVSILNQPYESLASGSQCPHLQITLDEQNQNQSLLDNDKQVYISRVPGDSLQLINNYASDIQVRDDQPSVDISATVVAEAVNAINTANIEANSQIITSHMTFEAE